MDAFGTALMQISPWKTAVMCIVPRVLIGIVCGFAYKGLSKTKLPEPVKFGISALSAPLTNTVCFMGLLVAFFWKTEYIQGVAQTAFDRFKAIVNVVLPIILGVVLLVGVVYAVILGVNYSKAEDAEKRKAAKERLVGAIVGFLVALVVIAVIYAVLGSNLLSSVFNNA